MRNRTLFSLLAAVAILASSWAMAGERLADLPRRHSAAAQDGQPVSATLASGVEWSAWAYRISGEYAIALSFREPGGSWSEPTFIGLDDRLDQIDPDTVADADGNDLPLGRHDHRGHPGRAGRFPAGGPPHRQRARRSPAGRRRS